MGNHPARSPLQILIVEDCPDTSISLAHLITHWGHRPILARNGSTALRLAADSYPDVVLLDIGLPDMDGWVVAQRLRAMEGGHPALVVVLSGYCQPEDREHSRQAGCHLHLAKPVDLELLQRLLREWQRGEESMAPSDLASLLTDLRSAAEVVDAIEDPRLQKKRGWNLDCWQYDLVPWGVRFRYQGSAQHAEVVATLDPRRSSQTMAVYLVE